MKRDKSEREERETLSLSLSFACFILSLSLVKWWNRGLLSHLSFLFGRLPISIRKKKKSGENKGIRYPLVKSDNLLARNRVIVVDKDGKPN